MVRLLNKNIFLFAFICIALSISAQPAKTSDKDYQSKEAFKKFNKRSALVASWQIQNLKFGAIVVRLQNMKRQIDAYKKIGDTKNAIRIQAEAQYHNRVIIRSVSRELNFCKVYFMYAQNSDSLLAGKRDGLFLDTNLQVAPSIKMEEKYYLIAEEYYVKNSSVGFVKEDTAKFISEKGNGNIYPTLVLKNKYGHQVKSPFPFHAKTYSALLGLRLSLEEKVVLENGKEEIVKLRPAKSNTVKMYRRSMEDLNMRLNSFYEKCQGDQINDPTVKPFLY